VDLVIRGALGLLWAAFAGTLAWYCARMLGQVTYVTLADGVRQERRLPLLFRLLLPLAPNLKPLLARPWLGGARHVLQQQLVAAGLDALLTPEDCLALRVLLPLLPGLLVAAVLSLLVALLPPPLDRVFGRQQPFLVLAILLGFFAYPGLWLRRELVVRRRRIQRALPFVLDLLTLSVEAGLDFLTALQRIVERRQMDPLGEETLRVLREIQLGKTRRDALLNMAQRADQPDLRTVVHALVQADELGVGVASVLRIQADQMRLRRFERAEKLANEAPVKMLFPLVAFIFPAVFLVLLGPIVLQILRQI
jgi:tight adherence protein C